MWEEVCTVIGLTPLPVPDPRPHKHGCSFHRGIKASKEILIFSDLSLALGLETLALGKAYLLSPFLATLLK